MMRTVVIVLPFLGVSACLAADAPAVPLKSGAYQFQWKDAEFPNSDGGCADADPFVVDFQKRAIWTCMWGP